MDKHMIIIKDFHNRYKFWKEKFKIDFDNYNNILVYNNFKSDSNFINSIKSKDFTFITSGYYFLVEKNIRSNSAEQILAAIRKSKFSQIPNKFVNGTYGIFISSPKESILFNDFLGLQTLYKVEYEGAVIFSTSIRVLSSALKLEKDIKAIEEFLISGTLLSGASGLKDVTLLPPSTLVTFCGNNIKISNYAKISNQEESNSNFNEFVDSTAELLSSATSRLYKGSVKYSLSLTGGMDSRLIYMNWPDRKALHTQTAGKGTSDYLKAKELVENYGDPNKHVLEQLSPSNIDGLNSYFSYCDNPLLAKGQHNMQHVKWKKNIGTLFNISGVGGELLGGENLYLTRKPIAVLKEAILPFKYTTLSKKLIYQAYKYLYGYNPKMLCYLDKDYDDNISAVILSRVVENIGAFIGETKYLETYLERIRTLHLNQAGNYLLNCLKFHDFDSLSPYNDKLLIQGVTKFEPRLRELRRATIKILQKSNFAKNIPIDTTHLKASSPYFAHKFLRVVRMVMNIGFKKEIPLLQKGKSPRQRFDPYFDTKYPDYRSFINEKILSSSILNNNNVKSFLNNLESKYGADFYIRHNAEQHIKRLLRISFLWEI